METFLGGGEPEIDYPCPWTYKVIGSDEAALRRTIASAVEGLEHTLEPSRTSSGGKYCSLSLVVVVSGHEQRRAIGSRLGSDPHVRLVL
jgi:uncharacterized protein